MKINIEIKDTVIEAAQEANLSPEKWVEEAINEKLQSQSIPTESEEKRIEVLAKIFKTLKSPSGTELKFDDESILRDLEARELIDLTAKGLIHRVDGYCLISGLPGSPITRRGIEYLERTKIDKFLGHPLYKLLKEIREWF